MPKKSAKVVHLRISVGDNDKRSMDKFRQDLIDAVQTYAKPKNVTIMGEEHLFEGRRYSVPEWQEFTKLTKNIEAGEQELASGETVTLDEVMEERKQSAGS